MKRTRDLSGGRRASNRVRHGAAKLALLKHYFNIEEIGLSGSPYRIMYSQRYIGPTVTILQRGIHPADIRDAYKRIQGLFQVSCKVQQRNRAPNDSIKSSVHHRVEWAISRISYKINITVLIKRF